MQLLNTLYLTNPDTFLRLENDTVRVEVESQTRLRVPLHHLQSVVCFGHVGLTTPLIHRLAEDGLGLVLCDEHGRFKARLEGGMSGNVLLRQAQHKQQLDLSWQLNLARAHIAGKVRNCRSVLIRGARDHDNADEAAELTKTAKELGATLRSLPTGQDLDTLRGYEGNAAKCYFAALNWMIRPKFRADFAMTQRSRRPPLDPFNALLSFVYSLWMNDCRSALEASGLDPQLGSLHAIRPGRAALALDLMEEFRPLADRLVLTLINRGQLTGRDFVKREGGAISLKDDARKSLLVAYQERKRDEVNHPLLQQPIPIGLAPFVQARLLARHFRGDATGYLPYLLKS